MKRVPGLREEIQAWAELPGREQARRLLLAGLPAGVVEGERNRRMLRRLSAFTTRPGSARLAREARLDLLPPGALADLDRVVDVGANEGLWSLAVLALARPIQLVAVEASPHMIPKLSARLHGWAAVSVIAAAVGETPGMIPFNITDHSHSASVLEARVEEMNELYGWGYKLVEQVTVPMTTLDEITNAFAHVSLLKIDVQGYERAVLAGAPATLRKTRWLLIEANFRSHYQGDMLFPEMHERLESSGFHLIGMSPPSIRSGYAMWADALYEHVGWGCNPVRSSDR